MAQNSGPKQYHKGPIERKQDQKEGIAGEKMLRNTALR